MSFSSREETLGKSAPYLENQTRASLQPPSARFPPRGGVVRGPLSSPGFSRVRSHPNRREPQVAKKRSEIPERSETRRASVAMLQPPPDDVLKAWKELQKTRPKPAVPDKPTAEESRLLKEYNERRRNFLNQPHVKPHQQWFLMPKSRLKVTMKSLGNRRGSLADGDGSQSNRRPSRPQAPPGASREMLPAVQRLPAPRAYGGKPEEVSSHVSCSLPEEVSSQPAPRPRLPILRDPPKRDAQRHDTAFKL